MTEKYLANVKWDLKRVSNLNYSNNQWLLCREQTWFNMEDIFYVLMLNQNIINEKILITLKSQ